MHPCFYLPVQWSRKSRPLHAKGLEQVLNWLQEVKEHSGCSQDEAGPITNSCFKNSIFYYVQFSNDSDFFVCNVEDRLNSSQSWSIATFLLLEALCHAAALGG